MINYIIYDKDGIIVRTGICQEELYDKIAKDGEFIMEGVCNEDNKKIVDGQIVDITEDIYEKELLPTEELIEDVQNYIRATRSILLAGTDWTQLPDNSINKTNKQLWADYRQELRDLPKKYANETIRGNVKFPSEPR